VRGSGSGAGQRLGERTESRLRVKSPKDAKERQTARNSMNAPQVYAIRLRKPAEHCSLSFGVLRRLGGFDL
jgi:hypothetical protein